MRLDGIETAEMMLPDDGYSWSGTEDGEGVKTEEWSVNEGGKDGEVMGTIVGGFNHSDAICSTPSFPLTVDIFPDEMRGVCVRECA